LDLSRRELLALGGVTLAGTALAPSLARGQTPKRGGTLTLRTWDPAHFDHMQTTAFTTHIPLTFTHSRLLKHKAGPNIAPGTFPLEGDLAESWSHPDATTYVFKLRRGVRFHDKPPVNGRELTAHDVVYTVERFLTVQGNADAYLLGSVRTVEPLDRYTVKFTLKEPFAWFLDVLATPMAVAIIAKECVAKFGDLKRAEAAVGTGPWLLESYRPKVGLTFVRNPNYFIAGLPYIDRVETFVDEDNDSRITALLAGTYDLGTEFPGTINRPDWVQIKDTLKQKRPNLRTLEYPSNGIRHVSMRTDRSPFGDVRVRQAMSLALDRQAMIDSVFDGVGVLNPPVPAALKDWSVPLSQLGEGAKYYAHDPTEAKRLLAAAGYPNGFRVTMCFHGYGSAVLRDLMQILVKNFKDVGIETKLDAKEYGAYMATCFSGEFDSTAYGPQRPFLEPDTFLFAQYYPGAPKNQSHINDPMVAEMLVRQRRTFDVAKRREIVHDIQRHLAKQQYYLQGPSSVYIAVWEGALKNYGPNLGNDYGGRLMGAWLDPRLTRGPGPE
jgi:peptide/nickel transport system substrate-binding protein